ncbi:sialate O-acetylesterase-like protein [Cricetulus griseus]|nr:sialate O-acetylesterase-like protein [Cricetulus griseus]
MRFQSFKASGHSPFLIPLMLFGIYCRRWGEGIDFRFGSYIDNYMVLQKEPSGAVIWGFGTPGATVTVTLCQGQNTFKKKVTTVKAHSNTWVVVLDPMKPGGPYEVMAKQTFGITNVTLRIHDILFGDVWLCSGQSNMKMTVLQIPNAHKHTSTGSVSLPFPPSMCLFEEIFNASKELAVAAAYQSVRIFSASLVQAEEELEDLDKVDLSWSRPTAGESNEDLNRDLYSCMFPALIDDWRQTFHDGSQKQTERFFPFGFVQLSSYAETNTSDYRFPEIRWHQTADFGFVPNLKMPNTFMAVAMDLCDLNSPFGSIHPRDKQTVAYRLHLGARALAYGEKNLAFQGPLPKKIELLAHSRLLSLTYDQKIQVHRQDNKSFEISCCSDRLCKWLPVSVNSFSTKTLILGISACRGTVVDVRYAWTTWPCDYKQCAVYHPSNTLPAPPFTAPITYQAPRFRASDSSTQE